MHVLSLAPEGSHSNCCTPANVLLPSHLHCDIPTFQQMDEDARVLCICSEEAAKQKHDAEEDLCQMQQQHTTLMASATAEGRSVANLLHLQSQLAAASELCKKVQQKHCSPSSSAQCMSSAYTHLFPITLAHPHAYTPLHLPIHLPIRLPIH